MTSFFEGEPRTINLDLPRLHPGQRQVFDNAARFNTLNCGRRFGKTVLGMHCLIHTALGKYPAAWFSPTYKMLTETWREVVRTLAPITLRRSEQEHRLELLGGGIIEMWSLEDPDSSRGRKYKRVIIDEAAKVPRLQEAWEAAIRPTLTDYRGDAWFLSTPKGYNYFKELYDRGLDDSQLDWRSWRMPTGENPFISGEEIADAERDLPTSLFAQEYLAAFEASADSRFNLERIGTALADCRPEVTGAALPNVASPYLHLYATPRPGVPYVAYTEAAEGKGRDYTVTYVAESRTLRVVATLRDNVLESGQHATIAEKLCRWYNVAFWGVERNRGEAILYVVGATNYPRVYWHTEGPPAGQVMLGVNGAGLPRRDPILRLGFPVTEQTRSGLIDDLAEVIEDGSLSCDDPVFWRECQSFVYNDRGRPEAAPGAHDDTVMCMAGLVRMARVPGVQSLRATSGERVSNIRSYTPLRGGR